MSERSPSRGLARSFWIPVASLVAIEVYASGFDGWGAWAMAPLFLVPLVLSLVIAGPGVIQCVLELRERSSRLSSMVFTFPSRATVSLDPRPAPLCLVRIRPNAFPGRRFRLDVYRET